MSSGPDRGKLGLSALILATLILTAATVFAWGNAGVYAEARSAYLSQLQDCEDAIQALRAKNWICSAQEKEALEAKLGEINSLAVASKVCATQPPSSETQEAMEARGDAEVVCRSEWLKRVRAPALELKNCKESCSNNLDCVDAQCVDGVCTPYPPCENDSQCVGRYGQGYFCIGGDCFLDVECYSDGDCVRKRGEDFECWEGTCQYRPKPKPRVEVKSRGKLIEQFEEKGEIAPEEPAIPELDEETKRKIKSWTGLDVDEFAAGMGKGKKGYIVISETLSPNKLEMVWTYKKVQYMAAFMKHMGYDVRLLYREDNMAIFDAISDPNAGAVAYFGHAAAPTVEDMDADELDASLSAARRKWYERQGMSTSEARAAANSQDGQGLDMFYNHSCHSADEGYADLANVLVKPGGVYYGEDGLLSAARPPGTEYVRGYE